MTFTKNDLKAGKERCAKATPEPWEYDGQHFEITTPSGSDYWLIVSECRSAPDQDYECDRFGHKFDANYDFIAHARADFPDALDALGEAWELLAFSKRRYLMYHQDFSREDRPIFRCDGCGELEDAPHEDEDCPVGRIEAILRATEGEKA